MFARPFGLLLYALVALLAVAAPRFLPVHWTSYLIQVLIFGLLALSTDLLTGHTGLVPYGHASIFAMAAYTTAIMTTRFHQHFLVSAIAGVLAGVLLTAVCGFIVRTSGVYFILVTIALGETFWGIAIRSTFTGGENGIVGVELPTIAGLEFSNLSIYYYVVLSVVGACVVTYRVLVASPFGLSLRGIRESESRMQTLGYQVAAHKFLALLISGTLAAIAGVLYVYWNKFVSPATAGLMVSSEAVLMAIIGGSGTLIGPFIGAAILTLIRDQLSGEFARWMIFTGTVFIATALFASTGVIGLWRQVLVRVRLRRLGQAERKTVNG